ncbi:MAG: hypothetical protein H6Q90_2761 [Deltaproteobacteria bacterium]|nr:hypothetical protein [Deltaproteobacteria bacterium]
MNRAMRRLVSVGVVLSAVAIAVAATQTASLDLLPSNIRVIKHPGGMAGRGAITLSNPGASPFDVGSITYSCGAAPAMQLLGGSGATAFQLAANGGTRAVEIECPSGLPLGMQRCTFTVHDGAGDPVTSFLGVCQTEGMPLLTRSAASVSFGTVPLGTSSPATAVSIGNTSAMSIDVTQLQLQVDDDSFVVGNPCSSNVTGCDASGIGPQAGSAATVEVLCHPTRSGPLSGKLFVIGAGNGLFLPLAIDLSCNGGTVAGPVLTVTPNAVVLAAPVEVEGGSASALVQLQNRGGGSLTITSLAVIDRGVTSGSNDWTFSVSGACTAVPCALSGSKALDVTVAFDPSAFNGRPATLLVNYDDGGVKQATVDLDGVGQGATLELVGTGAPLDFGTLPLTTPVTKSFALKNLGNRATTAHLATGPQAPFAFPSSALVTPGTTTVVVVTCQSPTAVTVSGRALTVGSTDASTAPFRRARDPARERVADPGQSPAHARQLARRDPREPRPRARCEQRWLARRLDHGDLLPGWDLADHDPGDRHGRLRRRVGACPDLARHVLRRSADHDQPPDLAIDRDRDDRPAGAAGDDDRSVGIRGPAEHAFGLPDDGLADDAGHRPGDPETRLRGRGPERPAGVDDHPGGRPADPGDGQLRR